MIFALIPSFLLFALIKLPSISSRFTEEERVNYWYQHHTWPPSWNLESPGYKALMEQREREIMTIPGADERWENWMQYIMQRMATPFTEKGFLLTKFPETLFQKIKKTIQPSVDHFETVPSEKYVDVIYNPPGNEAKMHHLGPLASEIQSAMLPLHEAWAGGIKLRPTSIYGVRFYQNGSSLTMHVDKPETHVISSIVHVGHLYDNDDEPWPIDIEDHDGNLHSISLEPGDMVFYESAKAVHGRMKPLKGKYYAGFFNHYQPVSKEHWNITVEDIINAIPPHWKDGIQEDYGSRWAGQCITTDSRVCEGAPARLVGANNPRNSYNYKHRRPSNQRPPRLDRWYTFYPTEREQGLQSARHTSDEL